MNLAKIMLSILMPPVVAWSFLAELARGIRNAFYYAWLAAAIEFATYKKIMRRRLHR